MGGATVQTSPVADDIGPDEPFWGVGKAPDATIVGLTGYVPATAFDLTDVPALVPLDRVEFRREIEVKPGWFTQVIDIRSPVKPRGLGTAQSLEVFAWLDGDEVVLSTGQRMHKAGGLVDLWVVADETDD